MIQFEVLDSESEKIKTDCLAFLKNKKLPSDVKITIQIAQQKLLIKDSENNKICLDFNNDIDYRRQLKSKGSELISRAVGAGKKGNHVLDLTAGMGVDAVTLTQLGYQVVSVERHPLVYLCLESAYNQWISPHKDRLKFIFSDVLSVIQQVRAGMYAFPDQSLFQVAYYDPMFPQKKKSALPRQEMVLLQKLTNEDPDSPQVIENLVKNKFFKRIVVKRPLNAETIIKPSSQLKGKLIRYDIYD